MRLTAAILVCLIALAGQGSGYTQTSAFTNSIFNITGCDITAARTIGGNYVSAPDLKLDSLGQVDVNITMVDGGSAFINQRVDFWAESYRGYRGLVSFQNSFTATNVKESSAILGGTSTSVRRNQTEYARIATESFGIGMATLGDGEYSLNLSGRQRTISNTVPALIFDPSIDEGVLKMAFNVTPTEFEEPVDFLQQNVSFQYATQYNQPAYYDYRFDEIMVEGDTTCDSYMSLSHID